MSTYKRIDGDYVITTINSGDFVTVNTNTLEVNGNLNVRGNLTYIETSELRVDDPFITVAANNNGTTGTAVFQNQGLVAQTSSSSFAGLRFHNPTAEWQISDNVTVTGDPISAYQPIGVASAGLPGAPVNSIQFNAGSGTFGGNAGFQFDAANTAVSLQGPLTLGNIGAAPAATANSVTLYNAAVGAGDTGVYVKSTAVDDELISRSKAVFYALIL